MGGKKLKKKTPQLNLYVEDSAPPHSEITQGFAFLQSYLEGWADRDP